MRRRVRCSALRAAAHGMAGPFGDQSRGATVQIAPSGATAKCNDGTYSFSQSRRGTCSSHGGVAAWL
ncbi:DUF3761 domain-containing protein [Curtobacterium ammoniigenes]|uniref:DUF3761 domain-containing protein n=1 Tax=Curtobacterium ammoniigenes TaxID=395387 RepID=UPI0009FB2F0B|nr:DUF3761 domain-containing protein [Curtobacterium ammoniigenes]